MDLSGLIFVALAIAWAAYLIPKALRHSDDVVRGRSIDRFSHSMRVLARREPVSARAARLVVPSDRPVPVASATTAARTLTADEQYAARRAATHRATKRRRRVLGLLLLATAGAVTAAALGRLTWPAVAVPVVLLVAWLVACRLMVRKEHAWEPVLADETGEVEQTDTEITPSEDAPGEPAEPRDPKLWDPVPVTLPTYVSKPPARRTVRTIDLDSTGVWTSGRTEADAALARDADAAEAADRVRRRVSRKGESDDRAVGS